jgi:hypothetical protein
MSVHMQPARLPGGLVPSVTYADQNVAATFLRGAVLAIAAGLVNEAAADPAAIYGVALAGANSSPGEAAANNPVQITGPRRKVAVARADNITVFGALLYTGGVLTTPTVADIEAQYGLTKQANGLWTVDKSKTAGSARVSVKSIDAVSGLVYFKFLPANITA